MMITMRRGLTLLEVMVIVLILSIMAALVFVPTNTPPQSTPAQPAPFDQSGSGTLGNHSYLAINKDGRPADMAWPILQTMAAFEESHPGLAVDSWTIEKADNGSVIYVFGLWVNHHPKQLSAEKPNQ